MQTLVKWGGTWLDWGPVNGQMFFENIFNFRMASMILCNESSDRFRSIFPQNGHVLCVIRRACFIHKMGGITFIKDFFFKRRLCVL